MKGRVDKSMGIVTLIPETLAKIKPANPLIFTKGEGHKKRNWSDSSGNSPVKILDSFFFYYHLKKKLIVTYVSITGR